MGMWLSIKSAMMKSVLFLGLALATNSMAQTIQNDEFWKDTDGNFIYSQGGGVLQVGDTYYWYGVKYNGAVTYAANPTSKNSDIGFAGVTCYSSKDLVNWKFEGIVLKPDQAAAGWFGRIGVAYNKNSKKYVLAGQGGSPSWEFGEYFATSDSPTGPFKFARVQTDLSFLVNGGTGDQTVFQDDDGKAYIICSNVKGRTNLYVSQLRDSDFLEMEASKTVNIHKSRVGGREGNAMFKHDGVYYFCSSDLHGWNTSQTYCMSATNIFGPYSEEFVLEGTQHDFSHVTQTGFFIMVNGTKGSFVVNAGDRWSDFAGNGLGFNQWLPISFESGKPVFHSLSQWNINVKEGTWSVGQGNNYCLNPSFEADRVNQTWLTGWKLASTSSENINNSKKKRTGRWSLYLTGKQTAYQTVNVPNGTYKLSGYVQSSGGQNSAKLFAKDMGSGEAAANITANSNWVKVQTNSFEVTSGKVTLGLEVNGSSDQWIAIDDIELIQEKSTEITLPEIKDLDVISKDSVIYEAEEGYIGKGVVESLYEGFSGESYVNLDNEVGSFLQIAVWNSTSGKRDFKIVYANGGKTSRPVQILVNDSIQIDSLDLSVTSDWTDWTEKTFSLGLPEGKSILTFKSLTADGAPNLDRIEYVIEDVTAIRKRNISAGLKMRKNARAFYINGRTVNENRPLPSKMKVYLK